MIDSFFKMKFNSGELQTTKMSPLIPETTLHIDPGFKSPEFCTTESKPEIVPLQNEYDHQNHIND